MISAKVRIAVLVSALLLAFTAWVGVDGSRNCDGMQEKLGVPTTYTIVHGCRVHVWVDGAPMWLSTDDYIVLRNAGTV